MSNVKRKIVTVPVATLWTTSESPREIDSAAITNPANVKEWLKNLTHDQLLDFYNSNRVQTQILFGQEVIVLEENEYWTHVAIPEQFSSKNQLGYPGWVPSCQLADAAVEFQHSKTFAAVTSKNAMLYSRNQESLLEISYETVLPVQKEDGEKVYVDTPIGPCYLSSTDVEVFSSAKGRRKGNGTDIVSAGKKFIGLPYLWGGMSSFGYDCSGFSYSMCKANGYVIPRDAHEQAAKGLKVELDSLEPGDLLFFAYEEGKGSIHHVGIYYGEGQLLHSPKTGKSVEIVQLSGMEYEKELCAARRYWKASEE